MDLISHAENKFKAKYPNIALHGNTLVKLLHAEFLKGETDLGTALLLIDRCNLNEYYEMGVKVAVDSLKKFGSDPSLLYFTVRAVHNLHSWNIEARESEILDIVKRKIGDPVYFLLSIAFQLIENAYIDQVTFEESWEGIVLNPNFLDRAAMHLERAIELDPSLTSGGAHKYDLLDCSWNEFFEKLLRHDKYRHLRMESDY